MRTWQPTIRDFVPTRPISLSHRPRRQGGVMGGCTIRCRSTALDRVPPHSGCRCQPLRRRGYWERGGEEVSFLPLPFLSSQCSQCSQCERLIRHVVLEQYRLPSLLAAADIALPITVLWGHLTNHNTTARKLFFPAAVAYGGRYIRAARDSARELCSSGARARGRIFQAKSDK